MNHIAFNAGVFALAAVLMSAASVANAQSHPQKSTTIAQADASCEKTVRDYVNALRYVKQTSGSGIAGHIEQAYVGESDIVQLAQQQGYCTAAQVLKLKGVAR